MIKIISLVVVFCFTSLWAQHDAIGNTKKQRLDFAKMYFEVGGTYFKSFTGKRLVDGTIDYFEHSASVNQYLTWGGYHFWGHGEFYVTFPLKKFNITKNEETDYQLLHSVTTGARFYPWVMKEKKVRPYLGLNWGALNFKQKIMAEDNQPTLSKDFLLNYEMGLTYNYKFLALRIGLNYFSDTKWEYPISKTQKVEIKTPPLSFQLGLLYTFDSSKNTKQENIDLWNSYPTVSKLSYDAKKFGDLFIGIGPSMSFSLSKSDYNNSQLPYLKEKLTSKNYFDIAVGYHFNKANLFTALSFRNPTFKTEGYDTKQVIKKTSITVELNKFLTDYTGFAPYLGLNVAYDKLKFHQDISGLKTELSFSPKIEPGVTFGWDIVPGKTNEALILRTNLRWYPFSEFEVENKKFKFNQLEYNLIQLVLYPERLKRKK